MTRRAAMDHDSYPDSYILGILRRTRTIAMVGASPKWNRPSYFAMKYLQEKGYRVVPVNPRVAGEEILGETVYADLASIPGPVDMVDIFRASKDAGAIVDQSLAVAAEKGISVIWMQLGVRDDEAARRAEAAGLEVVMDRCPKIEFGRLNTELSWGGFNSKVISSKRRRLRIA
ncbi:MAG: CoA-binding protein [Kiloniellales bacterium]|nr:CoA-binding protein [Kiloniellales bacterium]